MLKEVEVREGTKPLRSIACVRADSMHDVDRMRRCDPDPPKSVGSIANLLHRPLASTCWHTADLHLHLVRISSLRNVVLVTKSRKTSTIRRMPDTTDKVMTSKDIRPSSPAK